MRKSGFKTVFLVIRWICVFVLAVLLFFLILSWNGIYPFGSEMFLTEDLKYQYIDFYSWMLSVIHGEGSLFYIPNQGLGSNAWGLVGYYLSSPFNILIIFFDKDNLTDFAFLMTALKIGAIQVSMTWFIQSRFQLRTRIAFIPALCYTFSCWTVTQLRNPLWLDALIILPLACYAVYSFVNRRRYKLLIGTVTAAIITCWYTAYMIIVFLILYTILETIVSLDDTKKKRIGYISRSLLGLAIVFTVAILLSAFTFLPTILAMVGNVGEGMMTVPYGFTCEPIAMLSNLFVANWKLNEEPQLFAGTVSMLLFCLFLISKSVPTRVRIAGLIFVVMLAASIYILFLYYFWCGFRAPQGFYSRISFLWVFTLIWCGSYVLQKLYIKKVSISEVAWSACCFFVFTLEIWFLGGFAHGQYGYITLTEIAILTIAAFIWLKWADLSKKRYFRAVIAIIVTVCVSSELIYGAHINWKQLYISGSQSSYDTYVKETDDLLDELRSQDDSIFRIDRTYTRAGSAALNDGMAHGYLQLSSYSSAHNAAAINFLNAIGYSNEGEVSTRYSDQILLMDSLLGVKYVSDFGKPSGYEDAGFRELSNGASLYLNPEALSLAYGVSDMAVGFSIDPKMNVFERQNAFMSALLGRTTDFYKRAEMTVVKNGDKKKDLLVNIPENSIGYFYVTGNTQPIWVSVGGNDREVQNVRFRHSVEAISDIDSSPQDVDVRVFANEKGGGTAVFEEGFECQAYYLDLASFEEAIGDLAVRQCDITAWSGNHIECEYQADRSGFVLITAPEDPGWNATNNGVGISPSSMCNGALMLIPVNEGYNDIKLTYTPPGLVAGCLLSLATTMALMLKTLLSKMWRSRSAFIAEENEVKR